MESNWVKNRWRSEDFRRAVAKLPCVRCGVEGYTQAAHGGYKFGKGGSLKASDAALAALCGPRMGIVGCHALMDQGSIFAKAERAEYMDEYIAKTLIKMIETNWLILAPDILTYVRSDA